MPAPPSHPPSSEPLLPPAARAGWVYLVGAGPGDAGLITRRGAELLASADLVIFSEPLAPELRALMGADAEKRSLGRRGHPLPDGPTRHAAVARELADAARAGRSAVRLHGGDPLFFSRGVELARALQREGVPLQIVPGVTAPAAAAAYGGVPLTGAQISRSVTFVSAADADGVPADWSQLHGTTGTVCVMMAERDLAGACAGLAGSGGREGGTPAALIARASLPEQRTVFGTLADLPTLAALGEAPGPAVLIVGQGAALPHGLGWFEQQPLFGRRVLLTRPAHQAGRAAGLLRARGAQVLAIPTIAIEAPPDLAPLRRAVEGLAAYDVIIFTSENGVDRFWAEMDRRELDARALGSARLAVIGPGTAAALRARGLRPDIIPQRFVAERLAEAILDELGTAAAGARALLPRALIAREVLPDTLRKAGIEVDVVPVYQTLPASSERADELSLALEQGEVDWVMLTSSSMVEQLCKLLGGRAVELLRRARLASIGPITSATAERLGLSVAVTAEISTIPGVVDAMEATSRGAQP